MSLLLLHPRLKLQLLERRMRAEKDHVVLAAKKRTGELEAKIKRLQVRYDARLFVHVQRACTLRCVACVACVRVCACAWYRAVAGGPHTPRK